MSFTLAYIPLLVKKKKVSNWKRKEIEKKPRNQISFSLSPASWCARNANFSYVLEALRICLTALSWHLFFGAEFRVTFVRPKIRETLFQSDVAHTHAQLLCFPKTNWAGKVNRKKSVQKPVCTHIQPVQYIDTPTTTIKPVAARLLWRWMKERFELGMIVRRPTWSRRITCARATGKKLV